MEVGKWRSERGGGGRGEKLTVSSESCGVEVEVKAKVDDDADERETVSASSSDELPPYEALRASILCSVNGSNDGFFFFSFFGNGWRFFFFRLK